MPYKPLTAEDKKKLKNQDVFPEPPHPSFSLFCWRDVNNSHRQFSLYASSEHIRNIHSQPCIAASKKCTDLQSYRLRNNGLSSGKITPGIGFSAPFFHCCFENKKPFRCQRNGSEGISASKPLKKHQRMRAISQCSRSSIATRSCCMESRWRMVTVPLREASVSPSVSKSTVMQKGVPTSS